MSIGRLPDIETRLAQIPCLRCGRTPTAQVRIYGTHAIPGSASDRVVDGPFCRDCGVATFRQATESLLAPRWKPIASLATAPFDAIINIGARYRVGKLSPPATAAADAPPPGRPLLLRWRTMGAVIPLAILGTVAFAVIGGFQLANSKPRLDVGSCVQIAHRQGVALGSVQFTVGHVTVVSCDGPYDGKVVAEVRSVDACPDGDAWVNDDQSNTFCVRPA
jgi:hypothetical protein